jgi:hypothetical protein
VKKDGMGRACSMNRNMYDIGGKTRKKETIRMVIGGRIISKWILEM